MRDLVKTIKRRLYEESTDQPIPDDFIESDGILDMMIAELVSPERPDMYDFTIQSLQQGLTLRKEDFVRELPPEKIKSIVREEREKYFAQHYGSSNRPPRQPRPQL